MNGVLGAAVPVEVASFCFVLGAELIAGPVFEIVWRLKLSGKVAFWVHLC